MLEDPSRFWPWFDGLCVYPLQGSSILVSPLLTHDVTLHVADVEFRYLGDPDNPQRPALRIVGPVGSVSDKSAGALLDSYVTSCAFHSLLGRGVALSTIRLFPFTDSVLYDGIGAM